MGQLRYSINVTLDGCCDHRGVIATEEVHRHAVENIERADAMLLGRVTYGLMEDGWRGPAPADRPAWMEPFARVINETRKYVVSNTLERVDWNSELLRGDLREEVTRLKEASPNGVTLGGLTLPLALAEMGLIDEYQFLVQPRIVGHGPYLFAGLSRHLDLALVDRKELPSGAQVLRYEPRS